MSEIWFTSDLHLGHKLHATKRGFSSVEEHNHAVISKLYSTVGKRDKLFIIGDLSLNRHYLNSLHSVPGTKELILGNHDKLHIREYLTFFNKVHGFRKYGTFWLSHCPIHPQEMVRVEGNIHGHIHSKAITNNLPYPYFNVNMDFHNLYPVNFETIKEWFRKNGT
jgi:calcineurin-like phosphoesterase family protein